MGVQPYGVVIAYRAWVYFYMTYAEKLKHPKWQKKRLEILQRDNFKCKYCGDEETTLNIHHLKYNGKNPWEISNEFLITTCQFCHQIIEKSKAVKLFIEKIIQIKILKKDGSISKEFASISSTGTIAFFIVDGDNIKFKYETSVDIIKNLIVNG